MYHKTCNKCCTNIYQFF